MNSRRQHASPRPTAGRSAATVSDAPAPLAAAIGARAAMHAGGLVGGIGLKALDPLLLRQELAELGGGARVGELATTRLHQALEAAGIVYGVREEEIQAAVDEFLDLLEAGEKAVVARRVAEGEAPEPGEDGWIEYPQNHRGRPFHELAGLTPNSPRKQVTIVRLHDVLAILHPAVAPRKGTGVAGETLSSSGPLPKGRSLDEVSGPNTVISGGQLVAACDGACEEDVRGHLRVVPEIVIANVDDRSGRIPEAGLSQANIVVTGRVRGGKGIATAENLFVGAGPEGGTIEGGAPIQASNLVLCGRVHGRRGPDVAPVQVEEICAVGEVVNRSVQAGSILIVGNSRFARLDGERDVRIGRDLVGGTVQCRTYLQVNGDAGTEAGGSNTRVTLPADSAADRRKKKVAAEAARHREQMAELQSRTDELEELSARREEADPYWARLVKGERVPPQGAHQIQVLRQFADYAEKKRRQEAQLRAIRDALRQLAAERDAANGDHAGGATILVGGRLHLDVSFEIVREVSPVDGELRVNFVHEGNTYIGNTLEKARALLLRQVKAYREQHLPDLEEKRAAIDKMFEGRGRRPAGPELEDRTFELAVTWADEEVARDLEVRSVVSVRAAEPQKAWVKNTARVKAPMERVKVEMQAEGARGRFSIEATVDEPAAWTEDPETTEELAGIAVRGVSAGALLRGEAEFGLEDAG